MNLRKFQDEISRMATGNTKAEAHAGQFCVRCKKPPKFYTEAGRKEYGISGMCEPCFDECCTPPEETCLTCNKPIEFHRFKAGLGECGEFRVKPE